MRIVFVSDIFGVTDAFIDLCQQIVAGLGQTLNIEYQLISPYQQPFPVFNSEHEAYQYFTEHVGVANYAEIISKQISCSTDCQLFIGFSVGGSAIWQLCSETKNFKGQGVICFYSSQIRHMQQLSPQIPTTVILPRYEPHFSVTELHSSLEVKPEVVIENSQFLHGFMNELSDNYDAAGCQYYLERLANMVSQR